MLTYSSVTIPNSVTSISWDAFAGCTGLTSITIPFSVTSIGERAFYGCTSLTEINYIGTEIRWGLITKGTDAIPEGVTINFIEYSVGDRGPAGGYIFYDCDADNDSGNQDGLISSECGWRYLEAAANDLYIYDPEDMGKGLLTVSENVIGIVFGKLPDEAPYSTKGLFMNKTLVYNPEDCTQTIIGSGKINTERIVAAYGETIRWSSFYTTMATHYAAKECLNYSVVVDGITFDDWYLPSKDELQQIYNELYLKGKGDFYGEWAYWTSSETVGVSGGCAIFFMWFDTGSFSWGNTERYLVRPVRSF